MVSPRPSRSSRPLAVRFSRLLPPRSSALSTAVFAVVFHGDLFRAGGRPRRRPARDPGAASRRSPRFRCRRCRSRRYRHLPEPAPGEPRPGRARSP